MSGRPLRIVVMRDRYPYKFNTPRQTHHRIEPLYFLPTHRISRRIEAFTARPLFGRYDLIHAINRIPIETTPYIASFESYLPRTGWNHDDEVNKAGVRSLASSRCRAIIAMSHAAARVFAAQHKASPHLAKLLDKLVVIYPNIPIPDEPDLLADDDCASLRLTFVGAHFARKGGCVAVRIAELARLQRLPIHVNIVSKLERGAGIWTDPQRPEFYDRYLKLLDAENITFLTSAPNADVLESFARSHVSLLPTFGDTFGYTAIESMARWTPVLATRQTALPEFIDDECGFMLDLETDDIGEWVGMRWDRASEAFEQYFVDEVDRLARETIARLTPLIGNPARMRALRTAARARAVSLFDGARIARVWDELYEHAAERPISVKDELWASCRPDFQRPLYNLVRLAENAEQVS